MRALIVDDEIHVRDAIKLLADWTSHGITEIFQASNGELAVEIIEQQSPQIVMTDMRMPRKDGCELLSWLQSHRPDIKSIVISGYDDFDLVRHTVRNGGVDYILKPVEPGALNEALGKAVSAWKIEEEERWKITRLNIEMNQMKPLYDDRLLTDLVNGSTNVRNFHRELQERLLLPASVTLCTVAILSNTQFDEDLLEKFQNQQHLLSFTIINICNELLEQKGIAFRHIDKPGDIVILHWDESMPLSLILQKINGAIFSTLHRRAHFGLCKHRTLLAEIPHAYARAERGLWNRNLLDDSSYLHEGDDASPTRISALRNSPQEEKFRLAALSGASEQMERAATEWLDEICTSEFLSPMQLSAWNKEWDWIQMHWAEPELLDVLKSAEVEQDRFSITLPLNEYGHLDCKRWKRQILGRLTSASRTMKQQYTKDGHIVYDIAKYLEMRYNEDISLQDISSRFYLSREYISRKFKQEFGVTLLDYLSRIRIEKAKLLLMNPHMRISQIAEMVGYNDERYFSKVFKKMESRTPNEYRKEFLL